MWTWRCGTDWPAAGPTFVTTRYPSSSPPSATTLRSAAKRAANEFGFTRMWSIHPKQIRPILEAFAPSEAEIDDATKIIAAAARSDWAPISFDGKLHDRASYRYFWQVLERAHQTGRALPAEAQAYFAALY